MKKTIIAIMATSALLAACGPVSKEDPAEYIGKSQIKAERLTPELLQELGKISDLKPSPDGTKILYGVTYTSVSQNKSNRELFILNTQEKDAEPVNISHSVKSEQNAVWIDDQTIAFLSAESASNQIWTMKADGTNRRQISQTDRDIEGFSLSPDRQQVLLIMTLPVKRIDDKLFEGLDKTTGRLEDEMNYRHWDDFVDNYPHPYLAAIQEDGTLRNESIIDIMEGEPYECPMRPFGGVEAFAWTPDGTQIVYSCRKETGTEYAFSTRSSLYLYDIVSGQTVDLHPGDHGYDTNPSFSPDGKWLAFQSMARNGYESDKNRLCLIDMTPFGKGNEADLSQAHSDLIDLTAQYDNNVDVYTWDPSGLGLTFIGYSHGTAPVFHIDLNGNVERISDQTFCDYAEVCYCGDQIYTLRHDWHHPNEIFAIQQGVATQVTHENDALLSQLGDMGKFEQRMMKCTNGDSMLVWIAYPVGYNPETCTDADGNIKKVPTLLYCQGGPESAVSQFWSTRWNVAIMQANGYAIVLPNRHGVPGFGQAFNEQIAGDFAGQCMRDYFTAIDEAARESWCDKDRLGAVGASFGGYSVYWLAGHHENRFKALIAHCGIFNCESMYGETEEMWFADWDYGGSYFGQDDLREGLCHTPKRGKGINPCYTDSPHKSIQKWNTPILVIHNEHDYRIPVTQGMQAFNLARMRGVPARFLYFPDECHWVTKPQNAVLWQRVFFDWLDTYLK